MSGRPAGGHAVGHVDAEPVDATFQPEPQRLLQIVEDLRVLPVEVGLLGIEQVQVPLARLAVRLLDPRPGRAAEHRHPVVRRVQAAGAASVAEDVALALHTAGACCQRGLEPGVP
jgi:hypothetical protein